MDTWLSELPFDPLPSLLKSGNQAIKLITRRYLLGDAVLLEPLRELQECKRILRKQQTDGSWLYPGGNKKIRTQTNYNQIETYRNLGILIEEFALEKEHPAIRQAAEYLLSFQTQEGDLRGIYGNQYTPNYTAGIAELLIKAGYGGDPRVVRIFDWLLSIRQRDGGWAIPLRTVGRNLDIISSQAGTLEPDISQPFSHLITGVVLRAFAAHEFHRQSREAKKAGELLLSGLFRKDNYPDRGSSDFWLRFSFPFWYTDLISALDSLSLLGFSRNESQIKKALRWFREKQQESGGWELKLLKGHNRDTLQLWLALSICRIFLRFHD